MVDVARTRSPRPAAPEPAPARPARQPASPASAAVAFVESVVGGADAGSRERAAFDLQRLAGNRAIGELAVQRQGGAAAPSEWDIGPNPYAIETPGGGAAQPGLAANPYAEETDPVTLTNARFTGEPRLAAIAAGKASLSSADNGSAMRAVQQALIDLGFEMVQHERDGQFGEETRTAIRLFRAKRGIPGEELSARALGELDSAAPPPGKIEEHYFDYERLFADGYLDVTLAIGYDEGKSKAHEGMIKEAHDWLAKRGFDAAPPEPGKPELHRLRRKVDYPTKAGNRITREVIVRVNLITPGPGAAAQYATGLADSEIAIYNGHARRGIGPDFDEDKSAAENFVIGIASALHAAGRAVEPSKIEQHHYVVNRKNDLEAMTKAGRFDKEMYRVWLFEACTTIAYFDELRGGILPASMDRSNLDLLGTRSPALLMNEMASSLAMLDGILAAQTIEGVTAAMDAAGEAAVKAIPDSEITPAERAKLLKMSKRVNVHEGAGDNPVAPSSP